jgi:predicted transposase/invertase (TIGR01784 family)
MSEPSGIKKPKSSKLSLHDRFLRSVFTNPQVVREFFEATLPENIKSIIDLNSIEPQKGSFVTDELKLQVTDILFSAKFNNQDGFLYTLIEHSSRPDKFLPYRMLKYMTSIIDNHLKKTSETKLPLVYPIILHQGQKPYACSTDLFDLFEENKEIARQIMTNPVQLFDLATASDEDLKSFFWFGASALIAKHIKDPNILPTLKIVVELLHNIEVREEKEYIKQYITVHLKYIAEAADIQDEEEFREIIRKGLTSIDEENIMTLAEKWKQEGIQQGLQQGLEKGLEKVLEKELEIARSMLLEGIATETVVKVTGLSKEQVSELIH